MYTLLALTVAFFLPVSLALAFVLGRRLGPRPPREAAQSRVNRQHFELFQGAELNPRLLEAAKTRLQALLDAGDEAAVEAGLRPGEHFVVQVRALAELGTEAAGRILEKQLPRQLSDDHLEQTWYRIDLANGLRQLNRPESLPHLLRCADFAVQSPLGPVFAAETIGVLGFAGYLRHPDSALGRSALRLLHRMIEGFRSCLPPQSASETRLGELIEAVWDDRPAPADPLVVRVLAEAQRYLRRLPAARRLLEEQPAEREAFLWQAGRLEALEPALIEYLNDVGPELLAQLPSAEGSRLRDLLLALRDLRVETGNVLLPLASRPGFAALEPAVEVLAWSKDAQVGPWLRGLARPHVPAPGSKRRRASSSVLYPALLRALRGHPSAETEALLLLAARDTEPRHRVAALESLGWFQAFRPRELAQCLEENRRQASPDVRRAARAALARLGERSALQWFRQALTSDDGRQAHEAIHAIAAEGMTLLWPELDRLADADNAELSYHAQEALVVLSEEMEHARR